ncbi:MAG: aldo/keto reductase [Chloroflexota bacterium]
MADEDGSQIQKEGFAGLEQIEIGIGTWAWGDRIFWGYGREYNDNDLKEVFQYCCQTGFNFFDTAEVYGQGKSEKLLGKFIAETSEKARIATKFMPYPWRLSPAALLRALKASLMRMELERIDLYQMHWAYPPVRIETWMEAMAVAVHNGQSLAAGVSNYDRSQMQRAHESLTSLGVRLASNQVEYHLLNRKVEKNGLLNHCRELGVRLIAYSPLAQGALTGKYSPTHPMRGFRETRYNRRLLEKISPLIQKMRQIGIRHEGKTISQVAINWIICKGALPIPGIKTLRQAQENLGAAGWRLTEEEVAELDALSDRVMS